METLLAYRWLIYLAVFAVFLAVPIRLDSRKLMRLAWGLWLFGGVMLVWLGSTRFSQAVALSPDTPTWQLLAVVAVALLIGWLKGRFILRKTSQRNIDRLNALHEPQRPVHVYGLRSWIVIAVMIGLSVALNFAPILLIWRAAINIAIGAGLVASSAYYLQGLREPAV